MSHDAPRPEGAPPLPPDATDATAPSPTEVIEATEPAPRPADGTAVPVTGPPMTPQQAGPATAFAPLAGEAAVPAEPQRRDRLWVHFVWEGVLLFIIAMTVAIWVLIGPSERLGFADVAAIRLAGVAPFLLLATALALSMRVGAINLAVAHLAFLTPAAYVHLADSPDLNEPAALGITAGVVLVLGIGLALLVTVFRAPGWAASLVLAVVVLALSELMWGGILPPPPGTGEIGQAPWLAWVVIAAAVVISIGGGAIGAIPAVRRQLGICEAASAGTARRGAAGSAITWAALIGSTMLAGAAGMLTLLPTGPRMPAIAVNPDLFSLALLLGIVLIGGTAIRGRRGGIFGTVLASVLMFMVWMWFADMGWFDTIWYVVPVAALVLGLLVSWLLDLVNRPRHRSIVAPPAPPMAVAAMPVAAAQPAETAPPVAAEPVPVAEPAPAPTTESAAEPAPVANAETVTESPTEPVPVPATEPVPAADPVQAAEPVPAGQPVQAAEPGVEADAAPAEPPTVEQPAAPPASSGQDSYPYLYRPPA